MKRRQQSKVLPIVYTTLLLFVVYLKFRLIRASESAADQETTSKHLEQDTNYKTDDAEHLVVLESLRPENETETDVTESIEEQARKQVRQLSDGDDYVDDAQPRQRYEDRRRVKQNIYNFYNGRPPPARPSYQKPRPRPWPVPDYNDPYGFDYDDSPDYYQRPQPLYPPPSPPYQGPYQPRPYPIRPYPTLPPIISTTTTTTTAPSLLNPIGYMLINTYHTRSGTRYSKPVAFFGT